MLGALCVHGNGLSSAAVSERRWWTEGGVAGAPDAHDNPNDLITKILFPNKGVPDQCHLDYYHKARHPPGTHLDHDSRPNPATP